MVTRIVTCRERKDKETKRDEYTYLCDVKRYVNRHDIYNQSI